MDLNMLPARKAHEFRNGGLNDQGNGFELATATGRARCRCCGETIAKGEAAFVGWFDFTGNYGSWTSQRIWLHEHACQAVRS